MILYHRTSRRAARAIVRGGFRDGAGSYGTGRVSHGVWFSQWPLNTNEGAGGEAVLRVVLPIPMSALRRFEWIEHEKPYREWQLPATLVNTRRRRLVVLPPALEANAAADWRRWGRFC